MSQDTPTFRLGFADLAAQIPTIVGQPLENEQHNPENGDGLQATLMPNGAKGLLVWRKADNWTAFTDGFRTWIQGPNGLEIRLNDERLPWELGQLIKILDIIGEMPVATWNALETRGLGDIAYIVNHWDGGENVFPALYDPIAYYQWEARYHINKDWSWAEPGLQGGYSIMYHLKVARDGRIFQTRPFEHICWAAMGANRRGVQVCWDTNGKSGLTEQQRAVFPSLMDLLTGKFSLPHSQVWGHGEMTWLGNSTECAGPELLQLIQTYRGS